MRQLRNRDPAWFACNRGSLIPVDRNSACFTSAGADVATDAGRRLRTVGCSLCISRPVFVPSPTLCQHDPSAAMTNPGGKRWLEERVTFDDDHRQTELGRPWSLASTLTCPCHAADPLHRGAGHGADLSSANTESLWEAPKLKRCQGVVVGFFNDFQKNSGAARKVCWLRCQAFFWPRADSRTLPYGTLLRQT